MSALLVTLVVRGGGCLKTIERRKKLLVVLSKRRSDTISNLAFEFDVSERTIRRDVDYLSHFEPIYTKMGRHGGGVFVSDDYMVEKLYLKESVINLLIKILAQYDRGEEIILSEIEIEIIEEAVRQHSKSLVDSFR